MAASFACGAAASPCWQRRSAARYGRRAATSWALETACRLDVGTWLRPTLMRAEQGGRVWPDPWPDARQVASLIAQPHKITYADANHALVICTTAFPERQRRRIVPA